MVPIITNTSEQQMNNMDAQKPYKNATITDLEQRLPYWILFNCRKLSKPKYSKKELIEFESKIRSMILLRSIFSLLQLK